MKIVYISGPLTTGWDGKDPEYVLANVKKAEQYQIALANEGIGAFCAHVHTILHRTKGGTAEEEYYYELDMEILKRAADCVLAMPGWDQSYGAKIEVEWAIENGLPVFYPDSHTDLSEIVNWAKQA